MAESSEYRVASSDYNGDTRYIVSVKRTPETDAMTDEELIARFRQGIREHEEQQDG
ncbi:hypothetical protein [Streptomyces sp. NPDC051636]|uniref:hypothetical protein n=1 Tax=Streptomyces sp. NPDC051636 TaxID=3365663 RepID=UPI0037B30D52